MQKIKPALLLKYFDDTEDTPAAPSFLGGLPQLPPNEPWPTNAAGTPLHHLMQMDCAALVRNFDLGGKNWSLPDLPQTGTFFLFAQLNEYDIWQDPENSVRVVYTAETATQFPERVPPVDLKPLHAESCQSRNFYSVNSYSVRENKLAFDLSGERNPTTPWKAIFRKFTARLFGRDFDLYDLPYETRKAVHAGLERRIAAAFPAPLALPKIPIQPMPVLTSPSLWRTKKTSKSKNNLLDAHGYEAVWPKQYFLATHRHLPWMKQLTAHAKRNETQLVESVLERRGETMRYAAWEMPQDMFPWRWGILGWMATALLHWVAENLENAEAYWPNLFEDAERWAKRAASHEFVEPVSAQTSQDFVAWLESLDANLDSATGQDSRVRTMIDLGKMHERMLAAFDIGLFYIRGMSDTPNIPAEVIAPPRISPEESAADTVQVEGFQMRHQLLGYASRWQTEEDANSDNMLLFQISSDSLRLNLEVGVLHVWIKTADFVAGRFDRAWGQAETT